MSKTQKVAIGTNHGSTTNISKLLPLENRTAQITSGFGLERNIYYKSWVVVWLKQTKIILYQRCYMKDIPGEVNM